MPSLDDCPQTARQPLQERLLCLGIGGCFASESPAGFNRNARLLCVGTRNQPMPEAKMTRSCTSVAATRINNRHGRSE